MSQAQEFRETTDVKDIQVDVIKSLIQNKSPFTGIALSKNSVFSNLSTAAELLEILQNDAWLKRKIE